MGNVQCCASDLLEGKASKKPKNKKKNKKEQKESSEKTNGVGGGTINESVNKVTKVAEDNSDRPAPQVAQAQASPPPDNPVKNSQDSLNMTHPTDSNSIKSETRNETMATARERFFGQVYKI